MLYKITQTATIALLLSVVATAIVPRAYRLHTLGLACISFFVLVIFILIILVAPKSWREERKRRK